MKVLLMYKDRDFGLQDSFPVNGQELVQDLELNVLFDAMARGDDFIFDVVKKAVLSYENDLETILYRQGILRDTLRNPDIVREIYSIAVETIENRKKYHLGIFSVTPSTVLSGSVNLLQMFMDMLKKLRKITDESADRFGSEGFKRFFDTLKNELTDEFFDSAQSYLKELKFEGGVFIRTILTRGNEGSDYTLVEKPKQNWFSSILRKIPSSKRSVYTFSLHPRDDSGFKTLANIKNRAINPVANTLAQAAEHVLGFFNKLRTELAFYIGALNLYERLKEIKEPITFPLPTISQKHRHAFKGLYDICLALTMNRKIVGNDLNANDKSLIIITGANQGGKSTFLRSIGLAQLLMQCGMFVPAESFTANVCEKIFTHFIREEDNSMESGRLDEELKRMSKIVDNITPNSMVLFNESFSSTNEIEGSEIAKQIVRALLEKNIKIFFVTHMYEFANYFYNKRLSNVIFLRAERRSDGRRTFRIIEGKPLSTSYGRDLYEKIFGS